MPESSAPPLVVYPELWRQSLLQHPHDWRAQFRCLCQLARTWRENNRAASRCLPDGERMMLQALDQVDVEDMITTLESDFPDESNPLLRIDPSDPFVDKSQYPDLYPAMNGKRYHA